MFFLRQTFAAFPQPIAYCRLSYAGAGQRMRTPGSSTRLRESIRAPVPGIIVAIVVAAHIRVAVPEGRVKATLFILTIAAFFISDSHANAP